MGKIWVKHIDKYWEQEYIDEDKFDPNIHEYLNENDKKRSEEKAAKFKEGILEGKCPGLMMDTRNRESGITYKGKIDEGAIGDLIDEGLEGAKKRVAENKKQGRKTFGRGVHGVRRNIKTRK